MVPIRKKGNLMVSLKSKLFPDAPRNAEEGECGGWQSHKWLDAESVDCELCVLVESHWNV